MLAVVHKTSFGKGTDHDCRNARPVPENTVFGRRRNVVPTATMLIVGHDDKAIVPVLTVLDSLDNIGDVLLTLQQVGIAWVLIVGAERFDEAYGRQIVILQIEEEIGLVL